MEDFRLRVFLSAAKHLSFSQCAQELYITQPAVSKRIGELEKEFGVALFQRKGSGLVLTEAGQTFLSLAKQIVNGYNSLNYEMSMLTDNLRGELHVGASTTIAQYLLPSILAQFISYYPDVKINVLSGNSVQVEEALANGTIDIGLVENASRKVGLHYDDFLKDELVLVADTKRKYSDTDEMSVEELQHQPLVLRESGSGTLEVIEKALACRSYKLDTFNIVVQLGSTEAIKAFIQNSDSLAIVSIISVRNELKNNSLKVIDLLDVDMTRSFAFVLRLNDQNKLTDKFCQFIKRSINR